MTDQHMRVVEGRTWLAHTKVHATEPQKALMAVVLASNCEDAGDFRDLAEALGLTHEHALEGRALIVSKALSRPFQVVPSRDRVTP